MLLAYSLGLGIPFVFSAVLIDYLKSAFNWIKKNYKTINAVSGILLVLIGVLMATGTMGNLSLFPPDYLSLEEIIEHKTVKLP